MKATDSASVHHILIDHENVQPADLAGLDAREACVWVFTGAQQKVAISLIEAVQALGERGRFVRINGNGRNALDFHIAYYLGNFVARDPSSSFVIISADTGYDALIGHLKAQGIKAQRLPHTRHNAKPTAITARKTTPATSSTKPAATTSTKSKKVTIVIDPATPSPTPTPNRAAGATKMTRQPQGTTATPTDAQTDANTVVRRLADMPKNLPRSEASLRRMMGTWLSKDSKRLDAVIATLKQRNIIIPEGARLSYRLPEA